MKIGNIDLESVINCQTLLMDTEGIDGGQRGEIIVKMLETLYNTVLYDIDDMDGLLNVTNVLIGTICEWNKCKHVTHSTHVNVLINAVNKLRSDNGGGSIDITVCLLVLLGIVIPLTTRGMRDMCV